jgi:hypothetical protein
MLATAIGYSRIHTGVHYPGDVVIGVVIGTAVGEAVGWERGDWRDAVDDPRGSHHQRESSNNQPTAHLVFPNTFAELVPVTSCEPADVA